MLWHNTRIGRPVLATCIPPYIIDRTINITMKQGEMIFKLIPETYQVFASINLKCGRKLDSFQTIQNAPICFLAKAPNSSTTG